MVALKRNNDDNDDGVTVYIKYIHTLYIYSPSKIV